MPAAALIPLVIDIVEALIKIAPQLEQEFRDLFCDGTPTAEDFAALRARVAALDYKSSVPNSDLP